MVSARDEPPIMASRLVGFIFFTVFCHQILCVSLRAKCAVLVANEVKQYQGFASAMLRNGFAHRNDRPNTVDRRGEDTQLAVKVRVSSRMSTVMVSPSLNSPCNILVETGFSTYRWIARRKGRAP